MLKLFSMFTGYGGAEFALRKVGIEYECVGYSEIDKYAIKCYEQNFPKVKNYGDCTKIIPEELPDFDLLTGGFPCQSFSVAGYGLGELDSRGTLFNDIIRIAEIKQPKFIVLENVKGLITKKHIKTFEKILSELRRVGYDVKWKVLNSKEHGIPQNRERVIFVCFRKDLDNSYFQFPEKESLTIFIKDILEEKVNDKYMLKPIQIQKLLEEIEKKQRSKENVLQKYVSSVLCSRDYKTPKVVQIDVSGKGYKSQADRIHNTDGVMNCILNANPSNKVNIFQLVGDRDNPTTSVKEGVANTISSNPMSDRTQCIQVNKHFVRTGERGDGTKVDGTSFTLDGGSGNDLVIVHSLQPRDENRPSFVKAREEGKPNPGGYGHLDKKDGTTFCVDPRNTQAIEVIDSYNQTIPKNQDVSTTLRTNWSDGNCIINCITEVQGRQGSSDEFLTASETLYKNTGMFRRLTPKECFRLMGFLNDEINLEGISDSQAYKLAGNGWDINLFSKIFINLFKPNKIERKQTRLGEY